MSGSIAPALRATRVDVIVSSDKHSINLREYQRKCIVTAAQAVKLHDR